MSDAEAGSEVQTKAVAARPPVSKWRCVVASMFIFILFFIGFVMVRWLTPANWEFSIEAATEVAEIELPPGTETRWRIDGAVICARGALDIPDAYRVDAANSPCGSRAWRAWRIADPEQVIRLDGDATANMQLRADGEYAMSLRTAAGSGLGSLSVVGVIEDVALGAAINLVWTQLPAQPLTLPFSGSTTLGRAVSWSGTGMLRSGSVVVYTADESADKRTMVDDAALMLGDQVRLGEPGPGLAWPKGFVRVYADSDVMQVVAFGRADSLRIERYGESGYDFKPGPVTKLASDPSIAFLGSLLAAYMTLVLSLHPLVEDDGDLDPPPDVWQRLGRFFRRKSIR